LSQRIYRRAIIRGRVQGVGYRDWTRHVARDRGLEGWVRNRKDGSVEALFAGTPDAISSMIVACRKGPPNARVEWIEEHDASIADLDARRPGDTFSVIATL
jgi:acylphosphatase